MSKSLFILPLCLLLIFPTSPAGADQYEDCLKECSQPVAPCVEQARLTAGNVQEEQDLIAVCDKTKADCIQVCRDAEVTPVPPPSPPPQPSPEGKPPVDLDGGIKTYDGGGIKTYEFK